MLQKLGRLSDVKPDIRASPALPDSGYLGISKGEELGCWHRRLQRIKFKVYLGSTVSSDPARTI